jgi:hypothetical protein
MFSSRAALVFGIADLVTAALIVFGVFVALPARWVPVDSVAAVLAALKVASSSTLLIAARNAARQADGTWGYAPVDRWARRLARVAAAASLLVGLCVVTALALTASWLGGVYGSVGVGGAIVLALVAALALPYLIVLPAVELLWFAPRSEAAAER